MRLPRLAPLLCIALLLSANVRAGGLDAPGTKTVTVRSEIERGYDAEQKLESLDAGPVAFRDAVQAIEDKNEQDRSDTEGFRLGLRFGEWQFLWKLLSLNLASLPAGKERVDATGSTAFATNLCYKGFRAVADRIGLTKTDLKEVLGVHGYDPDRDDAAWENAVKASSFKGTKPTR